MHIDASTVKKVARVARVSLTDEEVKRFTPQLKEILEFFSQLKEAPEEKPSFLPLSILPLMRDDNPGTCLTQEEALKNTTHKKDGYFKGPRVV